MSEIVGWLGVEGTLRHRHRRRGTNTGQRPRNPGKDRSRGFSSRAPQDFST